MGSLCAARGRQRLRVFRDTKEFGGKLSLSQLFEILGLDVTLDDEVVAKLKTKVSAMDI